jgi:hypothetical protein
VVETGIEPKSNCTVCLQQYPLSDVKLLEHRDPEGTGLPQRGVTVRGMLLPQGPSSPPQSCLVKVFKVLQIS